jgi:hypothetical protein
MRMVSAPTQRDFLPGSGCILIQYGENIAGRIFEPGNGRAVPAHDPFFVRLDVGQIKGSESDLATRTRGL